MLALEHDWDLTAADARALQARLAVRVRREDRLGPVRTVAGVDVGFRDGGRLTHAAVAILSMPGLERLGTAQATLETCFPYVPGLLSFREIPAVLAALEQLEALPDLILCDGHGLAHPRRFGIACHLGVILDRPTIGVGKSRLVGTHEAVPETRGDWSPLVDRGEVIGAVLRTRERVKPIYVSIGHRVGLESCVSWVMHCVTRYRLPETTRVADRLASSS